MKKSYSVQRHVISSPFVSLSKFDSQCSCMNINCYSLLRPGLVPCQRGLQTSWCSVGIANKSGPWPFTTSTCW